ncbi:hypothetical protein THAOC_07729, partial [Thalassiosira oceanica]
MTTAWLLDQIHDHLGAIRDKTTEIFNPSHVAQLQQPRQKPSIDQSLPRKHCSKLTAILASATDYLISSLHFMLTNHIHGHLSYIKPIIIPKGLRNIIFIAFHSNPIGGHFQHRMNISPHQVPLLPARHYSHVRDMVGRDVAKLLVQEQQTWHRDLINSQRPDPRIYEKGDIVFARRAVRSNALRGQVDKLMYSHTGPFRIITHLDSKAIGSDPFTEAGIKGFKPPQPLKASPVQFSDITATMDFHFPSIAELNADLFPFPWKEGECVIYLRDQPEEEIVSAMYQGPPPSADMHQPPEIPLLTSLFQRIIASMDKLFFIPTISGHQMHEE